MARIRRVDSSSASLASSEPNRRDCRRSKDAMVWRLFFTRWWISRMVASFDTSMRSRRRSSLTSRTSTTAPSGSAPSRIGMARTTSEVSPRSISSITGARRANALWTAVSSKPTSASRRSRTLAWMPKRCRADMAFGLV